MSEEKEENKNEAIQEKDYGLGENELHEAEEGAWQAKREEKERRPPEKPIVSISLGQFFYLFFALTMIASIITLSVALTVAGPASLFATIAGSIFIGSAAAAVLSRGISVLYGSNDRTTASKSKISKNQYNYQNQSINQNVANYNEKKPNPEKQNLYNSEDRNLINPPNLSEIIKNSNLLFK